MCTSDLIGNYYLAEVDRFLEEYGVPSARYVDDIYIFVESVDAGDKLMRVLTPELRSYDLVLNEAKSAIMPKASLLTEEPDLEELFGNAVDEVSAQINDQDFDAEYGFQAEWEDSESEENEGDELELEATKLLFDSIEKYPGQEENIERFCLPLFSKGGADHAVSSVMDAFRRRPSMSQIYTSYLANFMEDDDVYEFMTELLSEDELTDWQKMWVLAALLRRKPLVEEPIKAALVLAKDGTRHDVLRAVAAIYVGRYGDAGRRKTLAGLYPSVSGYVQAAIYYSSDRWPGVERANARANWGNLTDLNRWLTFAFAKP